MNASKDCLITDHVFDTAKTHDSQPIDQLIEGETTAVSAVAPFIRTSLARSAFTNVGEN